jgi:peptide/nickel transport system permease protein
VLAYTTRRLLLLIPTLLGVSFAVFLTMHLAPGDPAQIMLGPRATATELARLRAELGLDRPFYEQYATWLWKILHGDWGRSLQLKRAVLPLVLDRFGNTAILALAALTLASLFGLAAGILAAHLRYTWADRLVTLAALLGFSIPVFWLALLLQLTLGLRLSWFPISGMYSVGDASLRSLLWHLILPATALAAGPAAIIARMTRSTLLETFQEEFIMTARAKGLKESVVLLKHALKNALIPTLTIIGMEGGFMLAGAVFVEMIFSWPGIGLLMVNGILARDFPLVQGALLLTAASYVFINLVVDLLYAYLNPRITYE